MRLVILDEAMTVIADYGEFTPPEAETFFADALSALEFRQSFPELLIRNELQMRLLTDTLAHMGLLHGNAQGIQQWMRPYIARELQRLEARQNLFRRAAAKLDDYRQKGWDWLKTRLFSTGSRLLSKFIKRL